MKTPQSPSKVQKHSQAAVEDLLKASAETSQVAKPAAKMTPQQAALAAQARKLAGKEQLLKKKEAEEAAEQQAGAASQGGAVAEQGDAFLAQGLGAADTVDTVVTTPADTVVLAQAATGVVSDAGAGVGSAASSGASAASGAAASGAAAASASAGAAAVGGMAAAFTPLTALVAVGGVAAAASLSKGSSSAAADTTAPVVQSLAANSATKQIVLTYNEALDKAHPPSASQFSIQTTDATGNLVANAVDTVTIDGMTVILTMKDAFSAGALSVTYTDATTGNDVAAIQDAAGNDAIGFIQGVVADGYIKGGDVYVNGVLYTKTNDKGQFFLPSTVGSGTITVKGGVNIDTGLANTTDLKAPGIQTDANGKVLPLTVNPLTTLVEAVVSQAQASGDTVTPQEAAAKVATSLNLNLTSNAGLLAYDPLATGNLNVQKAAAQVATILAISVSETVTDSKLSTTAKETQVAQITSAVLTNLAQVITNASVAAKAVSLTDSVVLSQALVSAGVSTTAQSKIADAATAISTVSTSITDLSSAQKTVLSDTKAPTLVLTNFSLVGDTGLAGLGISNQTTRTITFKATTGAVVDVKVNGVKVGTATETSTPGSYTYTLTGLADGSNEVTLAATLQVSGSTTTATATRQGTIGVDATAPTAVPTITALSQDTGASATDFVTKTAAQTVSGTYTGVLGTGEFIQVSTDGGTTWKNAVADTAKNTWSASNVTLLVGTNSLSVRAVDAALNATPGVAKSYTLDNVGPVFSSGATATAIDENTAAGQVVYTAASSDGTGVGGVTYSLKSGSGDASAFGINASTGAVTLTGKPDYETKSSYSFTVVATDAVGNATEKTVSLAINNLDDTAPSITSAATASVAENAGAAKVVYTATSTDTADTSTGATAYSLKSGTGDAAAFSINASTGAVTLTGNPDFEAKKSYSFTVVATDTAGNASEKAVTLSVTDVNEAPTANGTIAAQTAVVNQAFSANLSSAFADVDTTGTWGTLTYALTSGTLPAGLSLNSSTGVISGTATKTVSASAFTITATDGGSLSASQTFNLGVVAAPVIQSFTVTDAVGSTARGKQGDALTFTVTLSEAVTMTGTDKPTITFAVGSQEVVATYQSSSDSKTWVLTGTAPAGDGTFSVKSINLLGNTVVGDLSKQSFVTDAVGQTSSSYTLDNTAPSAPVLAGGSGANNSAASNDTTPTISGTAEANSTVTIYDGSTVLGTATADSSGAFSFTPTTEMSLTTHTLTAKATDTVGNVSAASTALALTLDTQAPTLAITSSAQSLAINESATITFTLSEASSNFTLDDVTAVGGKLSNFSGSGTSYTATFTADGSAAIAVSVASGKFTDAAGNGNTAGATPSVTLKYTVVSSDDYVTGAKVFLDVNKDGAYTSGTDILGVESSSTVGSYTFSVPSGTDTAGTKIYSLGGYDAVSDASIATMSTTFGGTAISYFSTQYAAAASDAAKAALVTQYGFTAAADALKTDPVAALSSSNTTTAQAAAKVVVQNQALLVLSKTLASGALALLSGTGNTSMTFAQVLGGVDGVLSGMALSDATSYANLFSTTASTSTAAVQKVIDALIATDSTLSANKASYATVLSAVASATGAVLSTMMQGATSPTSVVKGDTAAYGILGMDSLASDVAGMVKNVLLATSDTTKTSLINNFVSTYSSTNLPTFGSGLSLKQALANIDAFRAEYVKTHAGATDAQVNEALAAAKPVGAIPPNQPSTTGLLLGKEISNPKQAISRLDIEEIAGARGIIIGDDITMVLSQPDVSGTTKNIDLKYSLSKYMDSGVDFIKYSSNFGGDTLMGAGKVAIGSIGAAPSGDAALSVNLNGMGNFSYTFNTVDPKAKRMPVFDTNMNVVVRLNQMDDDANVADGTANDDYISLSATLPSLRLSNVDSVDVKGDEVSSTARVVLSMGGIGNLISASNMPANTMTRFADSLNVTLKINDSNVPSSAGTWDKLSLTQATNLKTILGQLGDSGIDTVKINDTTAAAINTALSANGMGTLQADLNQTGHKGVGLVVVDTTPPKITSAATASVAENQNLLYTAVATDTVSAVSYSLSGADAALLSVAADGKVTLKTGVLDADAKDAKTSYSFNLVATDASNNAATQAVTVSVTKANDAPTGDVTITGTPKVGQTLTAVTTTLADADGLGTLAYQWFAGDSAISGATSSTWTLGDAQAGMAIKVKVSYTDAGGTPESVTSQAVQDVIAPTVAANALKGVTNLDPRSDLVLTSDRDVTWAEGTHVFTITNTANTTDKAGFNTETTTHTQTISVTANASGQVTSATGGTVTIDNVHHTIVVAPTFDLDLSNNYSLSIDSGSFLSVLGKLSSGAFTPVSFSTVTPGLLASGASAAAASQTMNATTGAMKASQSWLDVTNPANDDPASGTYQAFDASGQDFAFVVKDMDTDPNDIQVTDTYIQFNNFGANDLLYIDNQLNELLAQKFVNENVFSGGKGTSSDPFSATLSGTNLASSFNVVVDSAVKLPTFTNALISDINSNNWSNTGIVVVG